MLEDFNCSSGCDLVAASFSDSDRLKPLVVLKLPLLRVRKVLIVKVRSAPLSPPYRLALGEPPCEDGVVREELEHEVEAGHVEGKPESPVDLHFIISNVLFKYIIIFS